MTRFALAAAVLLATACQPASPPVQRAECMIPVRAWCEAQARCHVTGGNLSRCEADGEAACASSEYLADPSVADPWACGVLQQDLACSPIGGTINDPESASCLAHFWRW